MSPKTPFFLSGGFDSDYGKAFLTWYFQSLLTHAQEILGAARRRLDANNFAGVKVKAQKLLGCTGGTINSHPAELTAGYYNTNVFRRLRRDCKDVCADWVQNRLHLPRNAG